MKADEEFIELQYYDKDTRCGHIEKYFDNPDEMKAFVNDKGKEIMIIGISRTFHYYNLESFWKNN